MYLGDRDLPTAVVYQRCPRSPQTVSIQPPVLDDPCAGFLQRSDNVSATLADIRGYTYPVIGCWRITVQSIVWEVMKGQLYKLENACALQIMMSADVNTVCISHRN